MMRGPGHRWALLLAFVTAPVLALPTTVAAQTGPGLLLQPWDEPTHMEHDVTMRRFGPADVRHGDDDVRLGRFHARGRFRTNPEPETGENDWRLGYRAMYWDLRSDDPVLPNRLADFSVAGGWSRQLAVGRSVGATAGVGYAGVRPFTEDEAVHGKGDLIFRQALDERSMLTFTLNYDGNRTLWPDIPLPLLSYSRRVTDELTVTLGAPTLAVNWRPHERWVIRGGYLPPWTGTGRVEYHFHDAWRAFVAFENDYHGFASGDDNRNRRLFFQQRRLETGVRYEPHRQWHLTLAGGYAFGQRLERGWDARRTTTVRRFDDAPYIRTVLGVNF